MKWLIGTGPLWLHHRLFQLISAVLVCGLAALFLIQLWLGDRVLPGVYVWDVDLGGLTPEQAEERLATHFAYPQDRLPVLQSGDQVWLVDPSDVGVEVDVASTIEAAMALGHEDDLRSRVEEQIDVVRNGRLVMPIFSTDPGAAAMFLGRIAQQVNQPARNAVLSFEPDLSIEITPSQVGREVDEEATRQALVQRIVDLQGGDVALVIDESEPVLTELGPVQQQLQRILGAPIVLTVSDFDPWTIEPDTLVEWLEIQPALDAQGNATLSVSLDLGPARELAEEIAPQVFREPKNARFQFDVSSEAVVPVEDGVPGQALDIDATVSLIEEAATSGQRVVPLPFTAVPPALTAQDAPDVASFELVGEGESSYAGSTAARITNIAVGAAQFDGVLVAPGDTFSFNHYLGEVTAEKGYAESIIIFGDETRADVGGGLCQVSSTAFRAAFWTGLPITERWPHTFRVSYYEPPKGLDATIYSPTVDLKWVNDTEEYILIRTQVDKNKKTLTFRFYGRNPGRTVEMDGPHEGDLVHPGPPIYREDPSLPAGTQKQIEWPKDGQDVTIYRIIKENGQEVRRDEFFSRYKPWQAVYLVGAKEE
jgi:vancomycin resistance protein YoaR